MLQALLLAAALGAVPDLHVRPPMPELRLRLDVQEITSERATQGVLVAATVALVVQEALIFYQRKYGGTTPPTISQVMAQWGRKSITLDFVAGNLIGHWFLPDETPRSAREARQRGMVLGFLTVGCVLSDIIDHSGRNRTMPIVALVGGIVSGHTLWGQAPR